MNYHENHASRALCRLARRAISRPHSASGKTALSNRIASGAVLLTIAALVLVGCGGGGGNAGTTFPANAGQSSTASAPTPAATEAQDSIVASSLVQQLCVAPRSGIDPATGGAFTDQSGTVAQEKSWLRAWIDETYLWFDEIPSSVRAADYATPKDYFGVLRTPALTPSGKPKDQFHFSYDTTVWQALTQAGVEAGYGFELAILKPQPPRETRVAYTDPGTPAALAGIARGATFLSVDGVDAVNGADTTALNAGLFPSAAGQHHRITLRELDGTVRTVTLTSANVTKTPVQNVKVIDTPTGKVGYLLFNDHIGPSEALLIDAIGALQSAGVRDLVLDIRYNGGGLLDIASQLAYMIATPAATTGTTFERLRFNSKNPFGLTEAQAATPFHATSRGFSTPRGQALPQLGLSRVTVLTGPGTCSASEAVINGLRGVNVEVNIIGGATCGKPYGFLPQDNCGTTYFAIQFKGVNNAGFGDYADGMAPTCAVADDFSRQLGDPAEGRLAAALSYRATGNCPPVASAVAKSGLSAATGAALLSGKSMARSERIIRPERP